MPPGSSRCASLVLGLCLAGTPAAAAIAPAATAPPPSPLVLSEVFYDAVGGDDQLEWVELFNAGEDPIDLSGWSLGWGGGDWTSGQLGLSGSLAAGEYHVVGGPRSDAANALPDLADPVDLAPDLQNGGTTADGVALFDRPAESVDEASQPVDAVLYGETNASGLVGPSGEASIVHVADAPSGSSVERDPDGWWVQGEPSPGAGLLVAAPEPGAGPLTAAGAATLVALRLSRRRLRPRPSLPG